MALHRILPDRTDQRPGPTAGARWQATRCPGASSRRSGASERHRATGTAYITGTPAAVATLLLAEGRIRRPGLLAPELLDPEPFFPMLEDRGIRVDERITWDPPA